MKFENMISFCELRRNDPILDFSEDYKKRNPDRESILLEHKDDIAIISGLGYEISWSVPHECECEKCNYDSDEKSEIVYNKSDCDDLLNDLKDCIEIWDIDVDEIYYVKAVKQARGKQ